MDNPAIRDLLKNRPIGSLATIGLDGFPHVVPIWVQLIEGDICMPTSSTTVKVRNLEVDNRAGLMLHEARGSMDLSGALIQGRIKILRGEQATTRNKAIHRAYLSTSELGASGVLKYLSNDDVTLVLTPEAVRLWDLAKVTAS